MDVKISGFCKDLVIVSQFCAWGFEETFKLNGHSQNDNQRQTKKNMYKLKFKNVYFPGWMREDSFCKTLSICVPLIKSKLEKDSL